MRIVFYTCLSYLSQGEKTKRCFILLCLFCIIYSTSGRGRSTREFGIPCNTQNMLWGSDSWGSDSRSFTSSIGCDERIQILAFLSLFLHSRNRRSSREHELLDGSYCVAVFYIMNKSMG